MKIRIHKRYFLGAAIFGLGLITGTFLKKADFNHEAYSQKLTQDLRYYMWDFSIGEIRFYKDVLWGNLGRRATVKKIDFFIAMWIYFGAWYPEERCRKVLKDNADIVFSYLKNETRRKWFFSTFQLTDAQKVFIEEVYAHGEAKENGKFEEKPSSQNSNIRLIHWKYDSSEFSFEKHVVEENNMFRAPDHDVSEAEIEDSTYFQYSAKGKTRPDEDGNYELLYLTPKNRLVVCPMNKSGFLRDDIYITTFSRITVSGDGVWDFEKSTQ